MSSIIFKVLPYCNKEGVVFKELCYCNKFIVIEWDILTLRNEIEATENILKTHKDTKDVKWTQRRLELTCLNQPVFHKAYLLGKTNSWVR